MINISILDDDKVITEILNQFIESYLFEKCIEAKVNTFNHPNDFFQFEENIDLLFLDISMPEISGMEVAEKYYDKYKDICIVFLTSHPEYIFEAFKVRAFRYIIKPIEEYELYELLNDYINNYPDHICLFYDLDGVNHILKENQILYIQSLGDTSVIITTSRAYETNFTLKQWSGKLDSRFFFQTYQSNIVNLKHISSFKDNIIMDNGKILPLSKRRKKDFYKSMKDLCN